MTKTPANANALDTFTIIPLFLFTGAIFPLDAFPGWLQAAAHLIPYTGLIEGTRGITLHAERLTAYAIDHIAANRNAMAAHRRTARPRLWPSRRSSWRTHVRATDALG